MFLSLNLQEITSMKGVQDLNQLENSGVSKQPLVPLRAAMTKQTLARRARDETSSTSGWNNWC